MTCIIGIEHEGKVYIGCDSISLNGWSKDITAVKKVFRKGDMLIGIAGNPRQMQILQYFVMDMPHLHGTSDEEYLVRAIVEPARVAFRERGFTEMQDGRETGASFLIGYRGKLYSVENGFQLCRSERGYAAMGVGDDFALGALQVLVDTCVLEPVKFLTLALETAGILSSGVCGPYYVDALDTTIPLSDAEQKAKWERLLGINNGHEQYIDKRFHEVKQWAEGQINSPPEHPAPNATASPLPKGISST